MTHRDREWIRLRVAIVPFKEDVYFFRISGPEALVNNQLAAFDALVKSVRFDDKKEQPMVWTEPKDWQKLPPGDERVAAYRINTQPTPIEAKITVFPLEKYKLLENLHRWQKQLNLPTAEADDIGRFATREKIGDHEITWVDMKGLGIYQVPVDAVAKVAPKRKLAPFPPPGQGVPFKFKAPEEWVRKPVNDGITVMLFEVRDNNRLATVTLTSAMGTVADNVNRWRGQVKLPPVGDAEAVKSAVPLTVATIASRYVDVSNPDGPPGRNRILGIMVPYEGSMWFIKMTGPLDLVGQNKAAFETFAKSFELDIR